jgi:hypothetical protein
MSRRFPSSSITSPYARAIHGLHGFDTDCAECRTRTLRRVAPLDTVYEAVRRTEAAETAHLRIAHLMMGPAPGCSLPKYAHLDFRRRVALVTEPIVTPWGALGDKVLERWPWLGDDLDLPSHDGPGQSLFVESDRLMRESPDEAWENVGSGVTTSPFGIFDRLAGADRAVTQGDVIRFRLPPQSPGQPPELGDLALDEGGRIRQILFTTHPRVRSRLPERLRPARPHWLQVDVLELSARVNIDVPEPLPALPPPPEPGTLRDAVALARRLMARRRNG